jgi:acyl-CoA thioester hydrolase
MPTPTVAANADNHSTTQSAAGPRSTPSSTSPSNNQSTLLRPAPALPAAGVGCATGEHFRWPLRIYWEDTDAGGVVFYANYLKLFERARTEWLRSLGFSQQAMRTDTGLMFVVTDTSVRYLQPAVLDDEVHVSVRLTQAGRVRLTLDQIAWRGDTRLAEGRIRIACVDAVQLKPAAFPSTLAACLPAIT